MGKALRWSGMDETKKGHPQLHKAIAQVFWKGDLLVIFYG
jgi:hypothetical protein